MRPTPELRRFALGLLLVLLTACGAQQPHQTAMAVGASTDPESALLANLYAAALRAYGTPARVEVVADPLAALDSGQVSVMPAFTGQVLQTFQPGAPARSDEQTYKAMVATLPEGVSVGDYTTAAEDKPAIAVTGETAAAWGGRDLKALVRNCAQVTVGGVTGVHRPAAVGGCTLPAVREFSDATALFDALRSGQVRAAWTTTADPAVPADIVVLADRKPALIQAQNVVPLYRRNELSQQQVLAINQVAGVLDTAALKQMWTQVDGGANPQTVAEAWLADNPLGR
jgi:glycine betaine/choline ABC-type transport system substrate-binding protein